MPGCTFGKIVANILHSLHQNNHNNDYYLQEHLILCATKLKPQQISNSSLLRFYWDFFQSTLRQSEKIILFGYSGNDIHVNDEIANARNKEIIIIEYSNQNIERAEREKDWAKKLNRPDNYFNSSNLIWLDSILDYEFNQQGYMPCLVDLINFNYLIKIAFEFPKF